ncbi:hypothetical protein GH733_016134 [Mirounga leonina]|nr:hypothetical protein GH733_016134 [Mirounga leonina]
MSFSFRWPRNNYLAPTLFLPSRRTGGNGGFLCSQHPPLPPQDPDSPDAQPPEEDRIQGARGALTQAAPLKCSVLLRQNPPWRGQPPSPSR